MSDNGFSKNIFKQKYLELLEKYKMELSELYIKTVIHMIIFFIKINCKYLEVFIEKFVIL